MDDSCGNYFPPYADMGFKPGYYWPFLSDHGGGQLSPDGDFLAYGGFNQDFLTYGHSLPIGGIAVMDVRSRSHVLFLPDAKTFVWSRDSEQLYYINDYGTLCIAEIRTKIIREYPGIGHHIEGIQSPPGGRFVFLTGVKSGLPGYGILRWDPSLDSSEFIVDDEEMNQNFMVLSDSIICVLNLESRVSKGIVYMNLNTLEKWRVAVPAFNMLFSKPAVASTSLSPDGTRILLEPYVDANSNDGYPGTGVWVLHRTTLDLRRVLPRHPFVLGNYGPLWKDNLSFIASWPCVCDSSISLYEYDLQGKPQRRYTDRYTKFWEVK